MTEVFVENFDGIFASDITADDIPEFAPLLSARPLLAAFITLFRGSEAEVLLRLVVLRELGGEAEAPRFTPEALRNRFSYVDPIKLETVLKRLRDNALLHFAEDGLYHLSDLGRNAVAALTTLLRFSAEEDAELGYLTAQLAGLSATGQLTPDALNHLLGKLNDLAWHFEEAIAAGSEFHILAARRRLSANLRWIEKGTHILRALLEDPEVPFELARVAQRVGLAQSRLARVDAVFQRVLNKIEAQRVTLGVSGISSSDVAQWMRLRDAETLAKLCEGSVTPSPVPHFLAGGHELLDRAELILSGDLPEEDAHTALPPAQQVAAAPALEQEDLRQLVHFNQRVSHISGSASLIDVVGGGGFAPASYRLSLLALLSDSNAGNLSGPVGEWMAQPFEVNFEPHQISVNSDEIVAISAGQIVRREK